MPLLSPQSLPFLTITTVLTLLTFTSVDTILQRNFLLMGTKSSCSFFPKENIRSRCQLSQCLFNSPVDADFVAEGIQIKYLISRSCFSYNPIPTSAAVFFLLLILQILIIVLLLQMHMQMLICSSKC